MKRDGKREKEGAGFSTPTMAGEAGRQGRYRPGINQDQNRVTEKRERTAAAAAGSRSQPGLHREYRQDRDHHDPHKAQMSGAPEQTHNSTYVGLKLTHTASSMCCE